MNEIRNKCSPFSVTCERMYDGRSKNSCDSKRFRYDYWMHWTNRTEIRLYNLFVQSSRKSNWLQHRFYIKTNPFPHCSLFIVHCKGQYFFLFFRSSLIYAVNCNLERQGQQPTANSLKKRSNYKFKFVLKSTHKQRHSMHCVLGTGI